MIQNPDFTDDGKGWVFHTSGEGAFTVDDKTAIVSIDAPGDNTQLYQSGLSLKPATDYRLSFMAASNDRRGMSIFVHQHQKPYEGYGLQDWPVELSAAMTRYEAFFTTPAALDNLTDGRLRFWFAPFAQAGTVYRVAEVELVEMFDAPSEPEPPAGRRIIHVITNRLESGDVLDVRYVPLEEIVLNGTDIDWDATRWRAVMLYAPDSD